MVASKQEYYELLGVSRDASEDEIRRAFRRLARQYHPDVNNEPGAETRFKEVNAAYEVLSDTEKRAHYDRFGHEDPQAGGFGGSGMGGFGFEDIFDTFFGSSTRGRRGSRGADLRLNVTLTLEETFSGIERVVEIPRLRPCPRCSGSGGEPGTQPIRCPSCNGAGEIRRVQQSIFGQFVNVTVCERCNGHGEVISTPCKECHGQRRVQTTQRLNITIPAGIEDGQQLRMSGEGESAPDGRATPGDLYVAISVAPHQLFKRQGSDLLFDLNINVAQAALGDEVEVPIIDGNPTRLRIPNGTQTGRVLRMRDRGMPRLRGGGRGDQLVRIRVLIPQELTEDQRRLFHDLARSFNGSEAEHQKKRPEPAAEETANEPKSSSPNGARPEDKQPPKTQKKGGKNSERLGQKDSSKEKRKKDKGIFEKVKDALTGESDDDS